MGINNSAVLLTVTLKPINKYHGAVCRDMLIHGGGGGDLADLPLGRVPQRAHEEQETP